MRDAGSGELLMEQEMQSARKGITKSFEWGSG